MQNVKWGEYRLGDLFDIKNTLSFNSEMLVEGTEYDYVTRTSLNQGILQQTGFVNKENINQADCWSLGLLQMDFFYRRKPWYAGQFVRKVIPKFPLNENVALYFSVLLNKQKPKLLSVLVRDVDKTFLNLTVKLPITTDNKIDFEFMESFIAELKLERATRLEAYLKINGLDNYELSKAEKKALEDFESLEFKEYKIGDIFVVDSYKKRFDANKVTVSESGKHPYVVRMSFNNGQKGYIDEDEKYLNDGNTISFGQDTATMFYQEKPYFTGDKIKILKPKDNNFNKKNSQYFLTIMSKSFSSFSWGRSSFSTGIIENQTMLLPIKNNTPDYEFMQSFISAIEKLVIRDVVLYSQKRTAEST